MLSNTIWVTGASGKLGTELVNILKEKLENKIVGTDIDVDITDLDQVNQYADLYRPAVIINCACIANAEYCEEHMIEAFKVNAIGARNLASASRRINAKLIHLSTDDIFEGNEGEFFTEFDTPKPVSVYGKSKLAGENYVRELNPKHLIIRSSWVYGLEKGDFLSYVLDQIEKEESFEVSDGLVSSPTSVKELAKFIATLIETNEYGIYHASSEGVCTRAEFAKKIVTLMGADESFVVSLPAEEKSSTLLENLMMKITEVYEMPNWETELLEYLMTRVKK